ncbi:MAG TPA: large conductance mechanosensitive channel protein MscL [Flavipsychrobacter sp.]|nr:large conductance mechanosensitive channel protein MscL [Chitinophagales bacterium]HLO69921.1 large conductance mechanosensitive channel protein MscL [Flavipsychrobacter sp.]
MGFFQDFKAFAMRGNVMDLAVGVVIGGAFGKIVTAMVDDILMPVIGMATGGQKFDDKFMVLKAAKDGDVYTSLAQAKEAGANVFAYGHFIQTIVDFLIIAFCIFLVVRAMARMQKEKEAAPPAPAEPSSTDKLLMEIRDALKK